LLIDILVKADNRNQKGVRAMDETDPKKRKSEEFKKRQEFRIKAKDALWKSRSGTSADYDVFKKIVTENLDDEGKGQLIGIMAFHLGGFNFIMEQAKDKKFTAFVAYHWTMDCDRDFMKLVRLGQVLTDSSEEKEKFQEIKEFFEKFERENVK